MASVCLSDEFVCPVCLEVLRDPATIPCGHTYCLLCIQKHWDQGAAKDFYSCPECRKTFNPRPPLSKSTMLADALEKLQQQSQQQGPKAPVPIYENVLPSSEAGLYPQLPTTTLRLCPDHQQPLEFYCRDHKVFVCEECSIYGHKGHQVVRPDEERREKQEEVVLRQAEILRRIQEKERDLQDMPKALEVYQDQMQQFQQETRDVVEELMRSLQLLGSQVEQIVLQAHEASKESRREAHLRRLQEEVTKLRRQDQELRSLSATPDDVRFLEEFGHLSDQGLGGGGAELFDPHFEAMKSGVRAKLGRLSDGLQDLNKDILAQIFRIVNDANSTRAANGVEARPAPTDSASNAASAEGPPLPARAPGMIRSATVAGSHKTPANLPPALPDRPAAMARAATLPARRTGAEAMPKPKTREELIKFRFEPTLDLDTAYRHIRVSDGDRKATLKAEVVDASPHPDRFVFWRQVLGREPLAGSPYYYEVEWTGHKVTVGVTYKELDRTSSDNSARLGRNAQSWALYWSGAAFSMWHDGKETPLTAPKAHRIGVFVDQQEGLLAFYRISQGKAELIHMLREHFSGPLFPGFRFWTGVGATITLCEL